jgi:hypothetical protein
MDSVVQNCHFAAGHAPCHPESRLKQFEDENAKLKKL